MNLVEGFLKIENGTIQDQGSAAWHNFRSKHIGASDIPAIMGTSDFSNAYKYWLEKTGQIEVFKGNYATEMGKLYESTILELYTTSTGNEIESKVVEYEAWPILSASLDGWVSNTSTVVEVKKPSKIKHEQALQGIVPETYRDQIQTQLLVTGASQADYVSFNDGFPAGQSIAIVKVERDEKRQAEILDTAKKMWDCIKNMIPPEGTCVQEELMHILADRKEISDQVAALEKRLDSINMEIKSQMKADKVICGDYTISWTTRKGSVDYSKIEALKQIDLELYRKPDTRIFNVRSKK